jgi:hypothetical protein
MSLPENWLSQYVSALRFLSGRDASSPEAKQGLKLVKKLAQEAYVSGRGDIHIPEPGPNGRYLEMNPSYTRLKTAIRANTKTPLRKSMWNKITTEFEPAQTRVKSATEPKFKTTLTARQQNTFMKHAAVAIPNEKGKYPALLGRKVPGELPRHGTVLNIDEIDPSEWAEGGFSPLAFNKLEQPVKYLSMKKRFVAKAKGAMNKGQRKQIRKLGRAEQGLRDKVAVAQFKGGLPIDLSGIQSSVPGLKKTLHRINVPIRALGTAATISLGTRLGVGIHRKLTKKDSDQKDLKKYCHNLAGRAMRKLNQAPCAYRTGERVLTYEEEGMMAGLQKRWRKLVWNMGEAKNAVMNPIKKTWLPAVSRRIIGDNLALVNTEFGLPNTTLDNIPIKRMGLDSNLMSLPNMQLSSLANSLTKKMRETQDENVKNAMQKRLGNVYAELSARAALFGL